MCLTESSRWIIDSIIKLVGASACFLGPLVVLLAHLHFVHFIFYPYVPSTGLTFDSPPPLPHSPLSYHHLFFNLSRSPCSFSFSTARFTAFLKQTIKHTCQTAWGGAGLQRATPPTSCIEWMEHWVRQSINQSNQPTNQNHVQQPIKM